MLTYLKWIAITPMLLALGLFAMPASAYEDETDMPTPLRLSYVYGDVSISRAEDAGWEEARVNLPLVAGDLLETGSASAMELQLGNRAFVRADANTRLRITGLDAHTLRIEIDAGRLSLDVRALPEPDYLIDVGARGTLFTLEREGYYRVDVDHEQRFVVRRGGQAVLIAGDGGSLTLQSLEAVWMRGDNLAQAETGAAPTLDAWDRWNLERTDDLIAAASTRYLPADVAGAYDLDHYGSWQVTAAYGPVWQPYLVAPGWVPYSSGHWIWDPIYQWTWIDDAPWGWAPFHYGRWITLGNRWAWVPGPLIRRAVYAPALVAFFHVGTHSAPRRSWVALGWGEPVVPWWGRSGFAGKPSWRGWGGPRIVNRSVVKTTAVIQVRDIVYANSRIYNALVAAPVEQFGRKDLKKSRLTAQTRQTLKPVQGAIAQAPLRMRGTVEARPSRTDGTQRWREEGGKRTDSVALSRSTARTRSNATATQRDDALPRRAVRDKSSTQLPRKPAAVLPREPSPRPEVMIPGRNVSPGREARSLDAARGSRLTRDTDVLDAARRAGHKQESTRETRILRDADGIDDSRRATRAEGPPRGAGATRDTDIGNEVGGGGRAEQRRELQRLPGEQAARGQGAMRSTPYGLTREFGRQSPPQRAHVPNAAPESRWNNRAQPERGRSFGAQ